MNTNAKSWAAIGIALIALVVGLLGWPKPNGTDTGGIGPLGSSRQNVTAVNVIGTQAAPQVLTGSFTTSTRLHTRGYDKLVLGCAYTPHTNNDYLLLYLEGSIDDGSTFFPLSTTVAGTQEIDVYADGGTGLSSTTSGIPWVFPGDKTVVANRPVTSTCGELTDVAYTHLRITALGSAAGSTSTLWLQAGGKIDN